MESIEGNLGLKTKLHLYLTPPPHFINSYQNALEFQNNKFQIKPRSIVNISNSSNTSPFFIKSFILNVLFLSLLVSKAI